MKEVYEINEDGFLIGVHFEDETNTDYITKDIPVDLHKPKWNGSDWIEDEKTDIQNLKLQLEQSDYMIIKCYEYQLAGKELPYNLEALHRDRQAMRDKINLLER